VLVDHNGNEQQMEEETSCCRESWKTPSALEKEYR